MEICDVLEALLRAREGYERENEMGLAFDSEEDQLECQRKARGRSERERERNVTEWQQLERRLWNTSRCFRAAFMLFLGRKPVSGILLSSLQLAVASHGPS